MDVLAATTEDSSAVGPTSARLEILKRSLSKKTEAFDLRMGAHFESVKSANGQPLNDKRNGGTTLAKWDRQNDSLRNLSKGIEKTKAAIEREESQIQRVESAAESFPDPIKREIASGHLVQWRKHPRTFFVAGVEKARIVLLDDGRLAHRYVSSITDAEQRKTFARTYNQLSAEIAGIQGGAL